MTESRLALVAIPTLWSDVEVERQTARVLRVKTLRHWRLIGAGPPYQKVGRRVFYRPEEIQKFLLSRTVRGES